jgi:membrane peptidoglycan carboxypeptidase
VSPTGIVRALYTDVRGGDITQGGSTITQQYAKNAYLSQQRSFTRKLKEIVIATKLGQSRSKSSVLEDYLNTIYFGRNAYGIAAAAHAYFHVKSVSDLSTAQGALLAAVIRGPGIYDPAVNRSQAMARWRYVLDGMVSQHWLSSAQESTLRFPHTRDPAKATRSNCSGTACYIRDAVEAELRNSDGFSQDQLDQGGYRIVTTINKTAQRSLEQAEQAVLPTQNAQQESGAASVKPGDGAIEALYGGRRYCHDQKHDKDACLDLSGASTSAMGAPSGSSMKAFTLIAALKQGISLTSTFDGPYQVTVGNDVIHNSSPGETCYGCTLTRAFAQSVNTIFVPLAKQVTPAKVIDAAYAAGIPKTRHLSDFPDVTLGPDRISPLDLADAYATIAARGVHATPYLVKNVTTTTGQRLYTAKPHTDRAFPASVAADTTYAMTAVLAPGGTAAGHALSGRPSAGKTGTTDTNSNAWFTGFTPQLCTSVWIGNVSRTKTLQIVGGAGEVFGGTLPATIWQQAMNGALAGQPVEAFPTPAAVGTPERSAVPTSTATSSASSSASPSTSPSSSPSASVTPTRSVTPSGAPSVPVGPSSSPSGRAGSPHASRPPRP